MSGSKRGSISSLSDAKRGSITSFGGANSAMNASKRGSISTESTRVFKGTVVAPRRDASSTDGASNNHSALPVGAFSVPRPPPPRGGAGDASASQRRPSRIRKQRSISLTNKPEASVLTAEKREGRRGETVDAFSDKFGNTGLRVEELKAKTEKIKERIKEKGLKEDEGEATID